MSEGEKPGDKFSGRCTYLWRATSLSTDDEKNNFTVYKFAVYSILEYIFPVFPRTNYKKWCLVAKNMWFYILFHFDANFGHKYCFRFCLL